MEEQNRSAVERKAFKHLKYDYKKAKNAKSEIDSLIVEWNDLYYGRKGDRKSVNSKIVIREIAKQIEWMKPALKEAFTTPSHPVRLSSKMNVKPVEKYLNYEFTQEFDREFFFDQLSDILLREGTVWVKTGWDFKEAEVTDDQPQLSLPELMARIEKDGEPSVLENHQDGTFGAVWNNVVMETNRPTMEIWRNEHVFPDPSARTSRDCRFVILKDYKTISDMKALNWIDDEKAKSIEGKLNEADEDSYLGSARNADAQSHGFDDSYQPLDKARQKLAVLEYWGNYDLDGDGIAEPVVARWIEKGDIPIGIEDNPMPSKKIPLISEVFSSRPFSLWGNSLAYFLEDSQTVKTGIVRGIMNNMSLANNGQKFVTRGALDYVNFKRMRDGEKLVIVNKPDGVRDGTYNNLPTSIFSTMELFDREAKDLSGVNSNGPALKSGDQSEDNDNQMTMSQQRMADLVKSVASLVSKAMNEWMITAKSYLTNEQIENYFSEEETIDYMVFERTKGAKINVKVASEASRNIRIQQINMLMQQSKVLGEQLPDDQISNLVAEMYEMYDMYEEAIKLREYKPEKSEMQIQMEQLEMNAKMLEVERMQLENRKLNAEIGQVAADAVLKASDAKATEQYKAAQTAEKYAKADSHRVSSALKPAEAIGNINSNKGGS